MREGEEQRWGIGKEFHQIYLIWACVKIHQNRLQLRQEGLVLKVSLWLPTEIVNISLPTIL